MGFWESGILGNQDFGKVEFEEIWILGKQDIGKVRFWECLMLGSLNFVKVAFEKTRFWENVIQFLKNEIL